jgi:hypothetical protein
MWQNLEMSACERRSRQWVAALVNPIKIEATCAGIRSEFQRPGRMEADQVNECGESRGNKEFQDSAPFIGAV